MNVRPLRHNRHSAAILTAALLAGGLIVAHPAGAAPTGRDTTCTWRLLQTLDPAIHCNGPSGF